MLTAALRRWGDALVTLALSPICVACERPLDAPLKGPVCETCWTEVHPLSPPLCLRCGDRLPSWRTTSLAMELCARCRRRPGRIARARAGGAYEGALRQIVHAFKYEGRRTLTNPLAAMMRDAGRDLLADADCVVPVPLHPWRRLRRGFNQAADLAGALDKPVVHALARRVSTPPQTGLTAPARRRNVANAFGLSRWNPRATRRLIAGRVVVLVDDVRTTGATLEACAHVLEEAGAREVRALTAAIAGSSR